MALTYRNTDRDWQRIGSRDPFWGVLSQPEFRAQAMTAERLDDFYATGEAHVRMLMGELERAGCQPFRARSALDFGCGVGRITQSMPLAADEVVGVDISLPMLEKARERHRENVTYNSELPKTVFDWIHSHIVFQHIPPSRGMKIVADLLTRLAPDGWMTLHFTIDRAERLKARTLTQKVWQWLKVRFRPTGQVSMYDYDLSALTQLFHNAGIRRMIHIPIDHDGHLGVLIIGRRDTIRS